MTTAEAAGSLSIAAATVRRQIGQGRITARKVGRDWWVTPREVERYRAEHLGRPGRRVQGRSRHPHPGALFPGPDRMAPRVGAGNTEARATPPGCVVGQPCIHDELDCFEQHAYDGTEMPVDGRWSRELTAVSPT